MGAVWARPGAAFLWDVEVGGNSYRGPGMLYLSIGVRPVVALVRDTVLGIQPLGLTVKKQMSMNGVRAWGIAGSPAHSFEVQ